MKFLFLPKKCFILQVTTYMKQKKRGLSSWEKHQRKQKKIQFLFWVIISAVFITLLGIFIYAEYL